jgi:elongator complex protein 1
MHASFSDKKDLLALLWEPGFVQVWDLNTRLIPGPEKIMNPVKSWSVDLPVESPTAFRRIAVSFADDDSITVVVLGSAMAGPDILVIVEVRQGKTESIREIKFPGRNGNLVGGSMCTWQDLTGQLFNG